MYIYFYIRSISERVQRHTFIFKRWQTCRMSTGDKQDFYFLKCKKHTRATTTSQTQTAFNKHVTLKSKICSERNEIKAKFLKQKKKKMKEQNNKNINCKQLSSDSEAP